MDTICIVDDDLYIGNMLEELLTREGYGVIRAYSGTEALLLLRQVRPALILLDLMLPGLSGEDVLSHIHGIPVIVLSAKADVSDKVSLLLGGAADYMTKPFDTRELLARIAVQLRKGISDTPLLSAGAITMDTDARTVYVEDRSVKLTKTEAAILRLLMQNPGHAISKSVMLDRIALDTPDCTDSSLKQHVSNLRKKLRTISDRDCIEAVWGIGFRLCPEES